MNTSYGLHTIKNTSEIHSNELNELETNKSELLQILYSYFELAKESIEEFSHVTVPSYLWKIVDYAKNIYNNFLTRKIEFNDMADNIVTKMEKGYHNFNENNLSVLKDIFLEKVLPNINVNENENKNSDTARIKNELELNINHTLAIISNNLAEQLHEIKINHDQDIEQIKRVLYNIEAKNDYVFQRLMEQQNQAAFTEKIAFSSVEKFIFKPLNKSDGILAGRMKDFAAELNGGRIISQNNDDPSRVVIQVIQL